MSTSPSWFDQEKFSRLVKKVGPKTVTEPLPSVLGSDPENRPIAPEGLASTARISLVSKQPSLLSEHRALPALPRRTAPLPSLRAHFTAPAEQPAPSPQPATESQPVGHGAGSAGAGHEGEGAATHEEGDLSEVWQKMELLNEELARAIHERDQALNEGVLLREELRKAEEANKAANVGVSLEELELVSKQRDSAMAETQNLRAKILQTQATVKDPAAPSKTQELSLVTGERDSARKEYAALRTQFEVFKQEHSPKDDLGRVRKEFEQQLEELRQKVAERDREILVLKSSATGGDEKLKTEVLSLREQLARAKDDASVAQRGLALSQKALHETRDTLREATEGTSLSRHNFDNLKNECAILSQQNSTLQAQNDQLTRDLAAAKSKLTGRL
jgi:hypothetical protein